MKKLLILAALHVFVFTSMASAASYKVSFSGAIDPDWQMSGHFTFDDTGLNKTGVNFDINSDFSTDIDILVTNPGSAASPVQFTRATAALYNISYDATGNFKKFSIGGNEFNQPGSTGILYGPDFSLNLVFGDSPYTSAVFIEQPNSTLKWGNDFTVDIEELTVSAVPLPAAAWMFLAGLGALFGGQKWRILRRKPALA